MSVIPRESSSTSGSQYSEFVRLLFLQDHRETDHFFAASGVQVADSDSGLFHYRFPLSFLLSFQWTVGRYEETVNFHQILVFYYETIKRELK